MKKATLGRPPLPPGEAKAARYELRLTAAEKAEAQAAAEAEGVPLAQWMRDVVLRATKKARAARS